MQFLPAGDCGLLLELDDPGRVAPVLAALQRARAGGRLPGIREFVPAARTILLLLENPGPALDTLPVLIRELDFAPEAAGAGGHVEIPVVYDGEDLEETAGLLGLSVPELIHRHTGHDYVVAFAGFAPGFAYLTGGPAGFDVPRRAAPRTRVPAGSVALAGRFSAVYPQASPGGWQLIGRTAAPVWKPEREPPALFQPGMTVRFVQVDELQELRDPDQSTPPGTAGPDLPVTGTSLTVIAPGLHALFQDVGRPGFAAQGVPASGAADRGALQRANRLVGNPRSSPVIEALGGGLQLRSNGPTTLAITGAEGGAVVVAADASSRAVQRDRPFALDDGDTLSLGPPRAGLRSCIAVRGGFAVAPVLGSASTDLLSGLGPRPLVGGQMLPVLKPAATSVATPGEGEQLPFSLPADGETVTVDVVPGPRAGWFTKRALQLFSGQVWHVSQASNRIGLRLEGEHALTRSRAGELESEGMPPGAIQVPPSGQPVVFLRDHPVTGGYPVIACVAAHHLDLVAQIPAGAGIRFRPLASLSGAEGTDP